MIKHGQGTAQLVPCSCYYLLGKHALDPDCMGIW